MDFLPHHAGAPVEFHEQFRPGPVAAERFVPLDHKDRVRFLGDEGGIPDRGEPDISFGVDLLGVAEQEDDNVFVDAGLLQVADHPADLQGGVLGPCQVEKEMQVVYKDDPGVVFLEGLLDLLVDPGQHVRFQFPRHIDCRQFLVFLQKSDGGHLEREPEGMPLLFQELPGKGLAQGCFAVLGQAGNGVELAPLESPFQGRVQGREVTLYPEAGFPPGFVFRHQLVAAHNPVVPLIAFPVF